MPKISGIHKPAAGAGELNFFDKGSADTATTCDFATGSNATFDGGGCICGTFSISTTAADIINCCKVFKYVGVACNVNDYITSLPIDIPQEFSIISGGII